jgi:hypothetical protein
MYIVAMGVGIVAGCLAATAASSCGLSDLRLTEIAIVVTAIVSGGLSYRWRNK